MMEFFETLCVSSALLSLALLFVPEKKGIREASITAFSLLLLLFLIPKDGSFSISSLLSFEENIELPSDGVYEGTVKEALSEGIRRDLIDRFSLKKEGISVDTDLTLGEEGIFGSYLSLSLGKENLFADVTAILRYIENTYGVDCEVHFLGD